MALSTAVCKEDCYSQGVFYKKGQVYQVDDRNPFVQRHFTLESRVVDKALEKKEKEDKS